MPIAVLYEHTEWFRPLFDELDRRRLPYVRIHAGELRWNPAEPPAFSLLVNRMSPSTYLRGQGGTPSTLCRRFSATSSHTASRP